MPIAHSIVEFHVNAISVFVETVGAQPEAGGLPSDTMWFSREGVLVARCFEITEFALIFARDDRSV
ncbi:hypothetical protein Pcar_3357 [Syntrophotalea carbinolica DSM 2380]|uniref:Uncharacterized protein n=1 Tax=Syntrophotalea carbinolica (strain DSM 2380 / NBRC 103641 / GraBd1) TaxID=338963 RepID=Q0C6G6_SYNC1|nr:hypothetical protein Pcar_3357 [Syntrophotalea carbinolica DSM 2380]